MEARKVLQLVVDRGLLVDRFGNELSELVSPIQRLSQFGQIEGALRSPVPSFSYPPLYGH